jgi:hypothetical protein
MMSVSPRISQRREKVGKHSSPIVHEDQWATIFPHVDHSVILHSDKPALFTVISKIVSVVLRVKVGISTMGTLDATQ